VGWCTVNDVVAFVQFLKQFPYLFRRMLEVIVHRHDDVKPCGPYSAQQRVVLPIVAHEIDTLYPRVSIAELLDDGPTRIPTAVIYKDHLVFVGDRRQNRR